MLLIQPAGKDDLHLIRHIARITWPAAYAKILSAAQLSYMLDTLFSDQKLLKDITEDGQKFIILRDDEEAVGFAAYGPLPGEKSTMKLHKIYVLPDAHGHGYGKMLMNAVIQNATESGFKRLLLNVNRYNKAKTFYEKIGFTVVREEDIPIGPYWMNDYIMALSLPRLPGKQLRR